MSGTDRRGNPKRAVLCDSPPCWRAPDGTRRRLIETLGRRRIGWGLCGKACERSLRGIAGKVFEGAPWKGRSPWEHPALCRANTTSGARDSWQGKNPGTAACEAGLRPRRWEQSQEKRYVGALRRKRRRHLSRGEHSEGRIPGALPVWNRTGEDSRGVSRQKGDQTLKAERSGQAKPAASGPLNPARAEGNGSPWEAPIDSRRLARCGCHRLYTEAKLDERRLVQESLTGSLCTVAKGKPQGRRNG